MNIIKYLFNWKYRHFEKKLRGVECMIEDLCFKRAKTLMIREDIRREYDNLKQKVDVIDTQLKQNKNPTLEDQKVLITRDTERLEAQMKGLDLEVNGSKQTNEYPDGVQGISQQLDALRELSQMVKEYIKQL